ncbi:MAG: sulfur oxidation c-type cytochrome SoxA [Rhodospirillaceae bacterium]|jgi:L-cysteine S-thiosulfotransferase|nr:sulfur oxidation c-type cytochrome SoxA [Rhodospirillaceae bacterium]MBT5245662.1 sulfur oxidation c-type cytochrome SoxA [Rhodospirillaceae bacterium]MBT5561239.1 sulfur oxidation c-type cytochrome SoxA [Rhodospirillaceae bacterium]MBT6240532.1 sulfur oxidation c-type cytochrome SoxA [Rhodospirillaceae bacterium]MBT7136601.1 sulfur oxidation c-type cytochrome SoxA [Rhodospirillaceae bacterium]
MHALMKSAATILTILALLTPARADEGEKLKSGYDYAVPATQAFQDDDFAGPALVFLEDGEAAWSKVDGSQGKSCASCHPDPAVEMKGVGSAYPKYDAASKKPISLLQKINRERKDRMGAKAWSWSSPSLLGISAFIMAQSQGMTFDINIDGPMEPFFNKGKKLYNTRNGQLNMACKHCHSDYADNLLRGNVLSNGLANGFPTYRLGAQKLVSLHTRFRGCEKRLRAQPFKLQSDEYVNLELFLKWRGRNIVVEMPSVRL